MTSKLKNAFLLLIIVPFWTNFLIRIFAWKMFLHPNGAFKHLLVFLGLADQSTILLYNQWAVLVVMIYTYLPFAVLPIYTAAEKFDFSLLDAAKDLGASSFYAFRRVFLPSISKGIGTTDLRTHRRQNRPACVRGPQPAACQCVVRIADVRRVPAARLDQLDQEAPAEKQEIGIRRRTAAMKVIRHSRIPFIVTLLTLVFLYTPLVIVAIASFNASKYGGDWTHFTWKWYIKLFHEPDIWNALVKTLRFSARSAPLRSIVRPAS